jgi:hypothetical protein
MVRFIVIVSKLLKILKMNHMMKLSVVKIVSTIPFRWKQVAG